MQLVFGFTIAIAPAATALHHHSRWAEQSFEDLARLLRMLIAFDRKGQSLENILFARLLLIGEGAQRRTENDRLGNLCRAPRIVLDHVEQKVKAVLSDVGEMRNGLPLSSS